MSYDSLVVSNVFDATIESFEIQSVTVLNSISAHSEFTVLEAYVVPYYRDLTAPAEWSNYDSFEDHRIAETV
jgi:hypothetical protein